MFGFVSDAQLSILKERNKQLLADNYIAVDKEVRGVVHAINHFPDMQTVWCCSGHSNDADDQLHFILALNKKGLRHLPVLSKLLDEHWLKYPELDHATLSTFRLIWTFDKGLPEREINQRFASPNIATTYPIWKIEYEGNIADRVFNNARLELIRTLEKLKP